MLIALFLICLSYRKANPTSEEVLGGLTRYYYDSQDLRLLLDLLANSSGVSTSLRVLSLFDTEFNKSFKAGDIDIKQESQDNISCSKNTFAGSEGIFKEQQMAVYGIKVQFQHATALKGIFSHMTNVAIMYTVELFEKTKDHEGKEGKKKIHVIPVEIEDDFKSYNENDINIQKEKMLELEPIAPEQFNMVQVERITKLEMSKEYIVCVNTVVNGKTLASKTEVFGPVQHSST
jgi:hypothetical protein